MNFGIIGIGNAGNQVAALAAEKLNIPAIAINSSQRDLSTLNNKVEQILIGDSLGAGKNRSEAKKFVKENARDLMVSDRIKNFMGSKAGEKNSAGETLPEGKDFVFIVSSTGGGTGSGAAPLYAEILKQVYCSVNFILVSILPSVSEALSTQVNTLEYFKELYETSTGIPYMVYDNERMSDCPSNIMMEGINNAIVEDISTIMGSRQFPTKYASIDEKDMTGILTTSGRIVIGKASGIKEKQLDTKTIDDLIISDFKSNCHAETNRDKVIHRMAVISYLDQEVSEHFNDQLPKVQEFLGCPVETFNHFAIKDEDLREVPNEVYVIASGLSRIDDRIDRIAKRIKEIEEAQEKAKRLDDNLSGIDIDGLNAKRETHTSSADNAERVDLNALFDRFGV